MRQAALARRVVHVARINKGGVAEDRRLRPLADDQRQSVGQNLRRDSLLETLQILGLGDGNGYHHQCQRPNALPKPGETSALHPVSFVQKRKSVIRAPFQSIALDRAGSNRTPMHGGLRLFYWLALCCASASMARGNRMLFSR